MPDDAPKEQATSFEIPPSALELTEEEFSFFINYVNSFNEGKPDAAKVLMEVSPTRKLRDGRLVLRSRANAAAKAHRIIHKLQNLGLWSLLLDVAGMSLVDAMQTVKNALEATDSVVVRDETGAGKVIQVKNAQAWRVSLDAAKVILEEHRKAAIVKEEQSEKPDDGLTAVDLSSSTWEKKETKEAQFEDMPPKEEKEGGSQ